MRTRIVRALFAVLMILGIGAVFAPTAQAACTVPGSTPIQATWGGQYVEVRTYWVRCNDGTNTYIRLQKWRYDDTSDISRTYDDASDPGCCPQTYWWDKATGVYVNGVDGYPVWYDNNELVLNNAVCGAVGVCGVVIEGRADRIVTGDTNFSNFLYIPGS